MLGQIRSEKEIARAREEARALLAKLQVDAREAAALLRAGKIWSHESGIFIKAAQDFFGKAAAADYHIGFEEWIDTHPLKNSGDPRELVQARRAYRQSYLAGFGEINATFRGAFDRGADASDNQTFQALAAKAGANLRNEALESVGRLAAAATAQLSAANRVEPDGEIIPAPTPEEVGAAISSVLNIQMGAGADMRASNDAAIKAVIQEAVAVGNTAHLEVLKHVPTQGGNTLWSAAFRDGRIQRAADKIGADGRTEARFNIWAQTQEGEEYKTKVYTAIASVAADPNGRPSDIDITQLQVELNKRGFDKEARGLREYVEKLFSAVLTPDDPRRGNDLLIDIEEGRLDQTGLRFEFTSDAISREQYLDLSRHMTERTGRTEKDITQLRADMKDIRGAVGSTFARDPELPDVRSENEADFEARLTRWFYDNVDALQEMTPGKAITAMEDRANFIRRNILQGEIPAGVRPDTWRGAITTRRREEMLQELINTQTLSAEALIEIRRAGGDGIRTRADVYFWLGLPDLATEERKKEEAKKP